MTTRHRRKPPVRTILGQRMRFHPLVDQQIAALAAISGRSFEWHVALLMRAGLRVSR